MQLIFYSQMTISLWGKYYANGADVKGYIWKIFVTVY